MYANWTFKYGRIWQLNPVYHEEVISTIFLFRVFDLKKI